MSNTNHTSLADIQLLQKDDRVTTEDTYGMGYTGRLDSIEVNLSTSNNPYLVHFADGVKQYACTIELAD